MVEHEQEKPFVLLHDQTPRREAAVAASLLVVLGLFRFAVLTHFNQAFLGGYERDSGLYIWLVRSSCEYFRKLPWFSTPAFYPYSESLAWSDNFLLPSLAVCPLLKAGVPLIAAYNLLMLTAAFFNGYFTYRLCFRLCGSTMAALAAGSAFMVSSVLSQQLGHPQLQYAFYFPAVLLLLLNFLRAPRLGPAVALGLLIWAAFLTAVYYALFAATLILTAAFSIFLLRPRALERSAWLRLGGGLLLGLTPLVPFVSPYLDVRATFSPRALYEAFFFSATGASYLSAPALNYLYGFSANWSHPEAALFPGLMVLALSALGFLRLSAGSPGFRRFTLAWALVAALCGVFSSLTMRHSNYAASAFLWLAVAGLALLLHRLGVMERKLGCTFLTNRDVLAVILACAFLFAGISLGPLGNPDWNQRATGLFRVFYAFFPGYNSLRAVGRAGIVADLCLFVLAGVVLGHLARKARLPHWVVAAIWLVMLAEQYQRAYPLQPPTPPPPIVARLAGLPPSEEALLVLPLASQLNERNQVKSWGNFAELNVNYMNWTVPYGRPLVNGYSGQRTNIMEEWPAKVKGFPDQRSLTTMASVVNLRYVLYISRYDPAFRPEVFQKQAANLPGLQLLEQDGENNYLFRVEPEVMVTSRTRLLAPADRSGDLSFELMASFEEGRQASSQTVAVQSGDTAVPIETFSVPQDGTWREVKLALAAAPHQVRPVMLTFQQDSAKDAQIYLRKARFAPTSGKQAR